MKRKVGDAKKKKVHIRYLIVHCRFIKLMASIKFQKMIVLLDYRALSRRTIRNVKLSIIKTSYMKLQYGLWGLIDKEEAECLMVDLLDC